MRKHIYSYSLVALVFSAIFCGCSLEEDAPASASNNPVVNEVKPSQAEANSVVTLKGTGLGDIRSVVFESGNVAATINPTLNTGEALIFRVPTDAISGIQNIVLTNGKGVEFKVAFTVLGYPLITSVSNYNFRSGDELTLTGKNLADVSKIILTGTDVPVTIVSQTSTSLVVTMPETDKTEITLNVENATGVTVTDQVFVNRDKAFVIFDDDYAPGYQDASWDAGGQISTEIFKSGTASVYRDYPAGGWQLLGFGWTNTANNNFKYLSFWIKGASQEYDLYIQSQQSPSLWETWNDYNKITVPAEVWTYFKIPVDQLKLWENGTEWNQLAWRIRGPEGKEERFYLDDIMFIY